MKILFFLLDFSFEKSHAKIMKTDRKNVQKPVQQERKRIPLSRPLKLYNLYGTRRYILVT